MTKIKNQYEMKKNTKPLNYKFFKKYKTLNKYKQIIRIQNRSSNSFLA